MCTSSLSISCYIHIVSCINDTEVVINPSKGRDVNWLHFVIQV